MISLDDYGSGSGGSVNLQPIYSSLSIIQGQILDISSQLGSSPYYRDATYLLSNLYENGYNITGTMSSTKIFGYSTNVKNFTVKSLDALRSCSFYTFTGSPTLRTIDIDAGEMSSCSFIRINYLKLRDQTMFNNTFSTIGDLKLDIDEAAATSRFLSNKFYSIRDLRIRGNYSKLFHNSNTFQDISTLHIQSISSTLKYVSSLTKYNENLSEIYVDEVKLSDMYSDYLKPFDYNQIQLLSTDTLYNNTSSLIPYVTRDFAFHCCNMYYSSDFKYPDTQSINGSINASSTLSFSKLRIYDTHTNYLFSWESSAPTDNGVPIFMNCYISEYIDYNCRTNPFMKARASNCTITNATISYEIVPSHSSIYFDNRYHLINCKVDVLKYYNSFYDKILSYPSNYSDAGHSHASICLNCSLGYCSISGCVLAEAFSSNVVTQASLKAHFVHNLGIAKNTFTRLDISRLVSVGDYSAIVSNLINTLRLKGASTLPSNTSLLSYLNSLYNTIGYVSYY